MRRPRLPVKSGWLLALCVVPTFILGVEPAQSQSENCERDILDAATQELPPGTSWTSVDRDRKPDDLVLRTWPHENKVFEEICRDAGGNKVHLIYTYRDPADPDGDTRRLAGQCVLDGGENLFWLTPGIQRDGSPGAGPLTEILHHNKYPLETGDKTMWVERTDVKNNQVTTTKYDQRGDWVSEEESEAPLQPFEIDDLPSGRRQSKKPKPQECAGEPGDVVPPPPPPPPPPERPDTGGSWGDPHLGTVDGLAYDFHGAGEYVFTRSTSTAMAIHVRFGRAAPGQGVSFNRGLAVRDGTDVVTFSDAAGLDFDHDPPVRVNGTLVGSEGLPVALPGGGHLDATATLYRLTTGDGTLVEVSRSGWGGYQVRPASSLRGALEGLLGNFDGDPFNDISGELYGSFGDRWLVPARDSLFTTTLAATELIPTYPDMLVDLSQFPADAVTAALTACRDAGVDPVTLEDCAIDVLVTGNVAVATSGAAAVAKFAAGMVDRDAPPPAQRLSGAVGVPVIETVAANATLEIAVPVEANRAFRLDPGPGCTPSPLVATVETPGTNPVAVDLGSCTDDRVLGTGPNGGELIVTLRALGTDVPATFAVVYADTHLGNGSFEMPVIESPYLTLAAGDTIGPWRVTAGDVDIQFTWAMAQHGRQSLDMSGFVGGKICQSFATTTGATYDVSFWMSHNAVGVTSASLSASITDVTSLPFTHDADSTNADPKWEQHLFGFTAAGSSSEICFASTDPPVGSGPDGAAMLDNVTVTPR